MVDVFFETESQRDLWLKLNADHQIEWEKNLTYMCPYDKILKPTQQAMNPRSMATALEIARNQLDYDMEKGVLRCTLTDYLLKSFEELDEMSKERHRKWVEEFKALK